MTLTERVARAMYERSRERWPDMPPWGTAKAEWWRSDVCAEHWTDEAEAAIREVLDRMRNHWLYSPEIAEMIEALEDENGL